MGGEGSGWGGIGSCCVETLSVPVFGLGLVYSLFSYPLLFRAYIR